MGTEGSVLKVLAVDDDSEITEMLVEMLSGKKYRVETADSGAEAVEIIERGNIDLVLLDIIMPGINGIETLIKIREIRKEIPVIMMTAFDDIAVVEQAFSLGACDFIFKPFNYNDLIESISLNLKKDPKNGKTERTV